MSTTTKAIPDEYRAATPYLIIRNAAKALDFYKQAFGANETMRFPGPEGKVVHAEIKIGDAVIMLADECPEMGARSPESTGGSPVFVLVYVEDVDTFTARAVKAGAKLVRPVEDQFYGDRSGTLEDPFGHLWTIATHKEDVSPEEMEKRMAAMQP